MSRRRVGAKFWPTCLNQYQPVDWRFKPVIDIASGLGT